MNVIVETVARPYTSAKYLITVEACDYDYEHDAWLNEVEDAMWEISFGYLADALQYLEAFSPSDASRIAKEHGRTCTHVSVDKCFYIDGKHQETLSYVAGVHWIDGVRTMYVSNDAYRSKPW